MTKVNQSVISPASIDVHKNQKDKLIKFNYERKSIGAPIDLHILFLKAAAHQFSVAFVAPLAKW